MCTLEKITIIMRVLLCNERVCSAMSKYISMFFLTLFVAVFLFFMLALVFMEGGAPAEEVVFTIGTIIVILLSFLITQVFYIIDLLKKRR